MNEEVISALHRAIDDFMKAYVERGTQSVAQRLDAIEQRMDQRGERPADAIRHSGHLYSIQQIADDLGVHPETAASWTRLPAGNPRRLVRCQDRPIRVLAADYADWLERQRGDTK